MEKSYIRDRRPLEICYATGANFGANVSALVYSFSHPKWNWRYQENIAIGIIFYYKKIKTTIGLGAMARSKGDRMRSKSYARRRMCAGEGALVQELHVRNRN